MRSLRERLRRFRRLTPAGRLLAVEAAVALLLARLLTRAVPSRHWLGLLRTGAAPRRVAGPADPGSSDSRVSAEIGAVVAKVVRHMPFRANCLPQAVAAQWMLRRRRVPSTLVFGVRRSVERHGELDFHAWLTVGGECVVGGPEVDAYSPFPPFAASRREGRTAFVPDQQPDDGTVTALEARRGRG